VPEAEKIASAGRPALSFLRNSTLLVLCSDAEGSRSREARAAATRPVPHWAGVDDEVREPSSSFLTVTGSILLAWERLRDRGLVEALRPRGSGRQFPSGTSSVPNGPIVGRAGGDLGRAEAVSGSAPTPLLLASTSPQRRAILGQLGIPFDVARPRYDEKDAPGPIRSSWCAGTRRKGELASRRGCRSSPAGC